MSLFSALFNVGIARRVGLWALIQALPDEDALQTYLRAAYRGLASVIIGAVLTGSAIAAGIAAAYKFLLEDGYSEATALAATAGFTLALIIVCFAMANRWFLQLTNIKDDFAVTKTSKSYSISNIVTNAMHDVADGFVEGLTADRASAQPVNRPTARRIRLIN